MSHIPKVESWIRDLRLRMEQAREGTPYYRQLQKQLLDNEKLLDELKQVAKHKPMREPGEEG